MNVYIGLNRIPDTYQEVEYIETTGTQFINTGLYAGNNIQVETKIVVNSTSQPQIVFACYKSSGSDDLPNYYGLAAYQNRWYYGLNGSEGNGGTYSPTIGTEYKIVYNNANNYININGSDVLNCAGTTGYAGTTLGIAVRANRNLSGSFKYYYFRMYNKTTGAYERDFVPCYRKADNVIGLYDLVNSVFYTNAGTGTFTKGNDVTSLELKNDYIGEVWTPGANTLLYLPFTDDLNDHSSNQTSTKGGTVSITTLDGVKCANFNSGYLTFPSKKWFNTNSTFSLWIKNPSNPTESSIFGTSGVGEGGKEYVFLWRINNSPQSIVLGTYGGGTGNPGVTVNYSVPSGWTHIVATMEGLVAKLYINGQLLGQVTMYYNNVTANTLYIGNNTDEPSDSKWWLKAYLSNLIIENKARTADEILNYYNQTKSTYGL